MKLSILFVCVLFCHKTFNTHDKLLKKSKMTLKPIRRLKIKESHALTSKITMLNIHK